ncbi:uncharacterized protein LOC136062818 [Quercus suber]|uniref:uncharacterized protein LOC136062818 n=1 Tax=Quercus suber TaxID=58331 RepID=UPI0032DFA01B
MVVGLSFGSGCMDQEVVNSLRNLKLTKEEEEDIVIVNSNSSGIFEECSLSLFGRLLSDRHQNLRALKNTLKAAWKMGSDLRIVEVGNNILQFKFGSRCQLEWVEKSGPWNFDNNLLLLCRWRKGLSSKNISFSHSPFWVQIWGLPFENMTEDIGRDIGSKIGRVLEVDKRAILADQAKFLRIRVEVQIEKPLRRGGFVKSDEDGRVWVDFRYERLPTFCYRCGILGHDEKHCQAILLEHSSGRQYGEWLRAGGFLKVGGEKEKRKEQAGIEKGGSAAMVVDGDDRLENETGGRSTQVQVGDGGSELERVSVSLMEADRLDMAMNHVMSNHKENGEQVRLEERLPVASVSEKGQKTREGMSGDRNYLVRNEGNGTKESQQIVREECGPDIYGAGILSPLMVEESVALEGEKKNGLVLHGKEGIKPIKPENKGSTEVDREQSQCPDHVVSQGAKRRFKRIARDKNKAQDMVKCEKAQEVSNKRKVFDNTLFMHDGNVQKRFCGGEKEGNENFFAEKAVTAEQHRLDQ